MNHCVYIHRRNDTGQIFYIGEGSVKYKRPYQKSKRNPLWTNITNKHGYTVEIWSYWSNQDQAWTEEIKLIAFYRAIGIELSNMTSGGEGRMHHTPSPETRKKLSLASKGKRVEHLEQPVRVCFLNEEQKDYISVSEAARQLGVSRRLIRMWEIGIASPKYHNVKSVTKVKGKTE
jgi:DNA-binding transcriptional regulator YiaG